MAAAGAIPPRISNSALYQGIACEDCGGAVPVGIAMMAVIVYAESFADDEPSSV